MIEIDLILDDDLAPEFPGLDASTPLRILQGDALEQLRILPAQSVQCCITSPPYWGLRDYGTAEWEGGEAGCEHKAGSDYGTKNDTNNGAIRGGPFKTHCGKCGARRIDPQLGLEATPEEYIAKMVAVFREVKRVLRDDGTLWLNLGDCYASTGGHTTIEGDGRANRAIRSAAKGVYGPRIGLKPKDLCMMPARLAMALQADGWYLRSEIVWAKPNPMPESVTDRPTKAHEMIYLLTKNGGKPLIWRARDTGEWSYDPDLEDVDPDGYPIWRGFDYFYDQDAIREPNATWEMVFGEMRHTSGGNKIAKNGTQHLNTTGPMTPCGAHPNGRNKRSVWTIATQPYAEAHFATFPEEIPKLCILAGTKPVDTVLDPFAGSGTVGKVALELGRRAILIELNPVYIQMIEDRTRTTIGMF